MPRPTSLAAIWVRVRTRTPTPLARAILGHTAGSVLSYRTAEAFDPPASPNRIVEKREDQIEVRILSVAPAASAPPTDTEARRQTVIRAAGARGAGVKQRPTEPTAALNPHTPLLHPCPGTTAGWLPFPPPRTPNPPFTQPPRPHATPAPRSPGNGAKGIAIPHRLVYNGRQMLWARNHDAFPQRTTSWGPRPLAARAAGGGPCAQRE